MAYFVFCINSRVVKRKEIFRLKELRAYVEITVEIHRRRPVVLQGGNYVRGK